VPFEAGDDGYPVQYRGVAASSPGLYFAGLPFLHSFASMLVGGAGRDAERVARHIVKEGPRQLQPSAGEIALQAAS
jgi:putative flavoprotein involved in K+ transport